MELKLDAGRERCDLLRKIVDGGTQSAVDDDRLDTPAGELKRL